MKAMENTSIIGARRLMAGVFSYASLIFDTCFLRALLKVLLAKHVLTDYTFLISLHINFLLLRGRRLEHPRFCKRGEMFRGGLSMDGDERLINLFRTCVVKVSASKKQGTGFFVAPGFILTCAHVVGEVQTAQISWQGEPFSAQVQTVHAEMHPDLEFSYPDLALLRVEQSENHPCAWLDESISVDDPLYSFGYPDKTPNGDSATFVYEGWRANNPYYCDSRGARAGLGRAEHRC
jgi:hypothetical protein